MRFCTKCGKLLEDTDTICSNCGNPVNNNLNFDSVNENPFNKENEANDVKIENNSNTNNTNSLEKPVVRTNYNRNNYNKKNTKYSSNDSNFYSLIGIALCVLMPLVGLILSIMGYKKSQQLKDGKDNIGTIGIVLNSVFLFVRIIIIFYLLFGVFNILYEIGSHEMYYQY